MKEYTQDEIDKLLKRHKDYLTEEIGKPIDLSRTDLNGANLCRADLTNANLSHSSLNYTMLAGANLTSVNLSEADLTNADLSSAELLCANLSGANLSDANLRYTDLIGANLLGADLNRTKLPAPTIVLLANWKKLSDNTTLQLMRLDASAHPHPELFDIWKETGDCPYSNANVQRVANFKENIKIWSAGKAPSIWEAMDLVLTECCKNWN